MKSFQLICCVVNIGDGTKTLRIAKKHGVKGGTISIGRGTVHNRLLELLKINEVRKEIVTMIAEHELAAKAIKSISQEMGFEKPDHGIAFSYPVSEFTGNKESSKNNIEISEVKESMYHAIYVVVDRGNAQEVIEAANKAGASGGTIMNARGSGIHEAQKFFSVEIELEKEVILIVTKNELKDSIISSIKEHIKIEEPGNGIMFVLAVGEAYGLYEG